MLLHRIRLKNVLSFGPDAQDLELKPLNVLIGPNGSGKSNLIEVVGLLKAAPTDLTKPIREGGGVRNWVWRGEPQETLAEVRVVTAGIDSSLLRYELQFSEVEQRFRLVTERLRHEGRDDNRDRSSYFHAGSTSLHLVEKGSGRTPVVSSVNVKSGSTSQSVFARIKGPQYPDITHVGEQFQRIGLFREWAFGRRATLRSPQKSDLPNDFLMEDGNNLGLVLNRLKRDYPKARDRLLSELRQLYESILDFDVSIEGGTVQVFLREGDNTVPATRLSDGTLRYLCLLAILCHPEPPPLICIEEPELGLHPDILPGLAELLRDASERCQLVVTTHSDVIVDALTDVPESVVVCEKIEGQTKLRRLSKNDLEHWLEKYRLGDLWTSGELGGNRW